MLTSDEMIVVVAQRALSLSRCRRPRRPLDSLLSTSPSLPLSSSLELELELTESLSDGFFNAKREGSFYTLETADKVNAYKAKSLIK